MTSKTIHQDCEPLISVVIPVYNGSRWLRCALDSVCSQTYSRLEIICVDDGSTDDSLKLLREYETRDKRFRVFHKENGGLSSARNAGVRLATGTWVAFLDADDYLEPETFSQALSYSQGVDMVVYGMRIVGELGEDLSGRYKNFAWTERGIFPFEEICCTSIPLMVNDKLIRRAMFEEFGLQFHEDLIAMEDRAFCYEMALHSVKVCMVPEKLYVYVQHGASIMHASNLAELYPPNFLRMGDYLHARIKRLGWRSEHLSLYAFWMADAYRRCKGNMKTDEQREQLLVKFCQFAERHHWLKNPILRDTAVSWGAKTAWAKWKDRTKGWQRFVASAFVSHGESTSKWKLFFIPVLKRSRRGGVETYRLLGIPVRRKKMKR